MPAAGLDTDLISARVNFLSFMYPLMVLIWSLVMPSFSNSFRDLIKLKSVIMACAPFQPISSSGTAFRICTHSNTFTMTSAGLA